MSSNRWVIGIPLKATQEVDFVKALKNHLKRGAAGSSEADARSALEQLTKCRNSAVVNVPDRHENGLNTLMKYYDQLCSMERRYPITDSNEVRVAFSWKDAFEKRGGLFSNKKSISSSGFEKACVLFNIGAFMTQMGANVRGSDDSSMQLAMKYLQQAAGIFQYLRDNVAWLLAGTPATPDLTSEMLGFLSALCLAQAQECIWVKAYSGGKVKPKTLAQVCSGTLDLYESAISKANSSKDILAVIKDENWIAEMNCKADHYRALSHFYAGRELRRLRNEAGGDGNYGEEIARYQLAEAALKKNPVIDLQPANLRAEVKQELNVATKDNNLIYHERIPDAKTLSLPEKTVIAKPIAFDPNAVQSRDFTDLFESIVPAAVANAIEYFTAAKNELVNGQVARSREATDCLNGVLASLNLPAAVEQTSGGSALPESLVKKAQQVQSSGGVQMLSQLISELPALLERNKEILQESTRLLKEEADQDTSLKNQYGAKWTRTGSAQLTSQLVSDQTKYQTLLDRAQSADQDVKSRFDTHYNMISLLSQPKEMIEQQLPNASSSGAINSPQAERLRELMKEVDAIKVERSKIEEQLQNQNKCDPRNIKNRFVSEMTPSGEVNAEVLSPTFLNEIYGELKQSLDESLSRQEVVLASVQEANDAFVKITSGTNEGRDEKLKAMAAAFDAFNSLTNHLREGQKFYGDLTEILLTHQGKVKDFVFARKTEKDDLLKDITSNARQSTGQPSQPSYHQTAPPAASSAPAAAAPTAASAPRPSYPAQSPAFTPMPQYNPYMPMQPQGYGAYQYGYGQMPPQGMYGQQPGPQQTQQHPGYPPQPGYPPYGYPAYGMPPPQWGPPPGQ